MKKTFYSILASALTLLLIFSVVTFNNSDTEQGSVAGQVVEAYSEETVNDAFVTVLKDDEIIARTKVKSDGSFSFNNLPVDILTFTIHAGAYSTYTQMVDLRQSHKINFGKIGLGLVHTVLDEILIEVKRKV